MPSKTLLSLPQHEPPPLEPHQYQFFEGSSSFTLCVPTPGVTQSPRNSVLTSHSRSPLRESAPCCSSTCWHVSPTLGSPGWADPVAAAPERREKGRRFILLHLGRVHSTKPRLCHLSCRLTTLWDAEQHMSEGEHFPTRCYGSHWPHAASWG